MFKKTKLAPKIDKTNIYDICGVRILVSIRGVYRWADPIDGVVSLCSRMTPNQHAYFARAHAISEAIPMGSLAAMQAGLIMLHEVVSRPIIENSAKFCYGSIGTACLGVRGFYADRYTDINHGIKRRHYDEMRIT